MKTRHENTHLTRGSDPPPDAPVGSATSTRESFRETADSVVVAFILAFVFRAFIIEAFVIPTGSMAATLYGKHGTVVCEDCQWEFAYGLDMPQRPVTPASPAPCPNCAHVNTNLAISDAERNAQPGDRILVLKWPLDLGFDFLGPQRWDVTVFKNPTNGKDNYIKRLIGLPNEVLEIIDGDIFAAPVSELSDDAIQTLKLRTRVNYLRRVEHSNGTDPSGMDRDEARRLWEPLQQELHGRMPSFMAELDQHLRVQQKTEDAQDSLWSMVYHHDYLPRKLERDQPRWQPSAAGNGWDTSARQICFSSDGRGAESIELVGKLVYDEYGYNFGPLRGRENIVGDLRLSCVLVPHAGEGSVAFQLAKREALFSARISADGTVELFGQHGFEKTGPVLFAKAKIDPLIIDKPVEVELRNVDYRVSLRVGGEEVLATTEKQYQPQAGGLRNAPPQWAAPAPRIVAEKLDLELWHVAVDRDVFYTSASFPEEFSAGNRGWATAGNPLWLREGEYFMLGDNSPQSQDSRYWGSVGDHLLGRGEAYQNGTVPEDQLIGRAFFVYWPAGLRIPGTHNLYLIPNVGQMRWIR